MPRLKPPDFLAGGGETGRLIRAFDWGKTPLGPPEGWPQALRTAIGHLLGARQPVYIGWGPDFISFYNDGYLPIVGTKHPGIGKPFAELWSEIWDEFRPLIETTMAGEAQHLIDMPIALAGRPGLPLSYFTFSYTLLRDETGNPAGFYCAATETTERVLAERQRAAEIENLRRMFEQAPSFLAVLQGPEHTFEIANEAYKRIVGGRDVVGKPIREALPEVEGQGFFELLDRVFTTGERHVGRGQRALLQTGPETGPGAPVDEVFLDFIYQPMRDAAGAVTGIFVEGYDVTDRQRADAALHESETRYRTLFENIDVGFCVVEVDLEAPGNRIDYRVLEANPAFYRNTGFPASILNAWMREAAPAMEEHWYETCGRVVRTGEPARFERGSDYLGRWFDSYVFRVGDPGERRVAILFNDISVRRNTEERLRQSEERYRALFSRMDEAFCVIEFLDGPHGPLSDYVHIEGNPALETNAGLADLVGKRIREIVSGSEADAWVEIYRRVLVTGEPIRFERELVESGRHLELAAFRVEPAELRQVAVLFKDATARHRAEVELRDLNDQLESRVAAAIEERASAEAALRQAQKLEAIGQLTGGVAHDFNNLLMIVQAGLNMLERRDDRAHRDMLVARMREAVTRGANLTRQLLAFSRKQKLTPEAVDFSGQITGMADLLDRSLGANVDVELELAPDLAPIYVDPDALQLAILNLAVNARDAMPNGGKIVIRAVNGAPGSPTAPCVCICVADQGTGMTPDVQARIFEPFFTTKEIGKGSGLGLAQVHGFAQQSGGRVEVETAPGEGTTITLVLPQSETAAGPALKPTAGFRAVHEAGEAGHVLLVEDDDEVAALTEEMLEHLGWRVTRAASAQAALGALADGRDVDLVFSDVMMPGGMSGLELAHETRKRRPSLPFVLASGYAEAVRHDAEQAGTPLLPKPFNLDTLAAVLEVARLN